VFFHYYLFLCPFFLARRKTRKTLHSPVLNLLILIFSRPHPSSHFPCSRYCPSPPFLPLRGVPSAAIHAIFFFLSSSCLSSHRGEDCRAISVGSDVTRKMHCPRGLGPHYMYPRCMHIYRGLYGHRLYTV